MDKDPAKLLVIGAGVNGSICAMGLHRAGFNVTLLARGQRYEELIAAGVVIEDPFSHTQSTTYVPLVNTLEPTDCYDYILVVVRKSQVMDLLPTLAQNISPNIVFMINNPSGPDEYTKALSQERVMLGFVFGGGRREGSNIRAMIPKRGATPFGEINGTITPRLTRLVAILCQAGLRAEVSRNMVDWQATHAALIPSLAIPVMKYHLDARALSKSKSDLGLMVDGMRETLDVLQAVGYHITPRSTSIIRYIPRFLLIESLRLVLPTKFMEVGGVWHVSQAGDEMIQIGKELAVLVEKSGLPVPALREMLQMNGPMTKNHHS
ncbi:MAG: 2-dehydropantoate 2-reductase N-terminal domain-containing protein [Anaerolineaceae bacterium]|nr:2-dehydropantoate 2-reductase N-terminal domain-containing protein [Anaerolineaceae bacterium]